jgi:hypothetical protein
MADENYDAPGDVEDDGLTGEPVETNRKSSKPWLTMLARSERHFRTYHDKVDGIEKMYASLERLGSIGRDREFQMFWANIQTLAPSIYARPPVPVVVPRHRDRRPLYRTASEFLERAIGTEFDMQGINEVMLLVRDDLVITGRGVPWVRYETKQEAKKAGFTGMQERVVIEHLDRKDFRHDPVRYWKDVDWVARRGWLTKTEMRKRFRSSSGEAYLKASYRTMKDTDIDSEGDSADLMAKAGVWELHCRSKDLVVWVTEGCEDCLDYSEPEMDLDGFFPCPRPAYGTLQRRSTVPVPDFMFYKDQLEEVNQMTARLAAIGESLRLKGFFPASLGDIGDAIQAALNTMDDRATLVPIANWAAFGEGVSPKDMIVWLPLQEIAAAANELINIRKQLIDDIYQLTGMSDIMRGSTEASETLGAQQLKAQYGSVRTRDRQQELVRVAADLVKIVGEIMAENFSQETLLTLSQMELPTDKDVKDQVKPLQAQIDHTTKTVNEAKAAVAKNPELQAQLQTPEGQKKQQEMLGQANQQVQALGQQIGMLQDKPTIDGVMKLLRSEKLRPFALDIETDSTINADEQAQKSAATEYLTAMGGLLAQAIPALEAPGIGKLLAPLLGETIRFAQSHFRVGRQMDQVVDEFVQKIGNMPDDQGPTPEQQAAQADQQKQAHEQALAQQEAQVTGQERLAAVQKSQADNQIRLSENARKDADHAHELAQKQAIGDKDLGLKDLDRRIKEIELQIKQADLSGKRLDITGKQVENAGKAGTAGLEIGDDGETPQPIGTRDTALTNELLMHAHDKLDQVDKKIGARKRIVKHPVTREPVGIETEGETEIRPFEKDPATGEIVGV